MKLSVSVEVNAPRDRIWNIISNIEGADQFISGIEKVEVLEKPEVGLKGFKWRETRTLFGKTATEVMWITDVVDGQHYEARAESHGSVYESKVGIDGSGDKHTLYMTFEATPQTLVAKVLSFLMAKMMKNATQKALQQDLEDIKTYAEQKIS